MKLLTLRRTVILTVLLCSFSLTAGAHCDTMDGPVVKAAQAAIARNDVTLVLQWVKKDYEPEVRQAFQKIQEVRKGGDAAKELADLYFFETLVRLHRAGEGEPYTGLKPSGTPIEPIVQKADMAIEHGSSAELAKDLTLEAEAEIAKRFKHVLETRQEAGASVEAGREYVEAYVEFVHFVEQLQLLLEGHSSPHGSAEGHEAHK